MNGYYHSLIWEISFMHCARFFTPSLPYMFPVWVLTVLMPMSGAMPITAAIGGSACGAARHCAYSNTITVISDS